jgi:DNA-directed RNA polymerase sigma subunit (sigma70/sigma32)
MAEPIQVTHWKCWNGHVHPKKDKAEICEARGNREKWLVTVAERREKTKEREILATRLRGQGLTLKAIGQQLGVSAERVRGILARHRRRQIWGESSHVR